MHWLECVADAAVADSANTMKIVIFGSFDHLFVGKRPRDHVSRVVPGAASRAVISIVFFERNVEWYENNRDLPEPALLRSKVLRKLEDRLTCRSERAARV